MGLLIDSTALLELVSMPETVMEHFSPDEEFYLSIITADELLRSVTLPGVRNRARRMAFVEAVLDKFPILPIDRPTVRMHAEILSSPQRKKSGMSMHASWIAATCLTHGLSLVSMSPADYQGVNGLRLACLFHTP